MSDSKENVDVLKMYGEDSTTQRDEFLKKHNLMIISFTFIICFITN